MSQGTADHKEGRIDGRKAPARDPDAGLRGLRPAPVGGPRFKPHDPLTLDLHLRERPRHGKAVLRLRSRRAPETRPPAVRKAGGPRSTRGFNHPNSRDRRGPAGDLRGRRERRSCSRRRMSAIAYDDPRPFAAPAIVVLQFPAALRRTETLGCRKTLANLDIGGVGFLGRGRRGRRCARAADAAQATWAGLDQSWSRRPPTPEHSGRSAADAQGSRTRSGRRRGNAPVVVCDNTLLGPLFQKPLLHGADISVYSLTKYVGGHSDLIAGAALGSKAAMKPVRMLRSAIGTQLDPFPCWLIARSLETLALRMRRASENADIVAAFLKRHPKVARVHHLSFLEEGSPARRVYDAQCDAPGSTLAFDVVGDEAEAFKGAERAAGDQARGLARRHRVADLPSRVDHPLRAFPARCAIASASATRRSVSRSASSIPTTSWPTSTTR